MDNCNGKSISNETIFPNLIRIYFAICLLILSTVVNAQGTSPAHYKIKRVVIDAGHGGRDPGAVGKITYEKHITLGIALKLGKFIEDKLKDVKVIYTRKTDVFIPLDERSEIANQNKADVFISIHVNSLENKHVMGTSSWVMGLHKSQENLKIAQRENSVVRLEDNHHSKYEGFDPTSSESFIMFSLMQNVYINQSLLLASKIQNRFGKSLHRIDRGVNQAGFVVLWKTSLPAVLVETGFISNATEEKYLNSKKGQREIAHEIFQAFKEYKSQIEGKSATSTADAKTSLTQKRVPETPLPTVKKEVVAKPASPTKHEKTAENPIWFSVQIRSSPTKLPLTSPSFRALGSVFERKEGGLYKYFIGKVDKLSEVAAVKTKARKYYKDAFTVAFEGNKKISVKEAMRKL